MKWYECAGIGIGVGLLYGILIWFIKSQLVLIYSQALFRDYYDPGVVAFFGAALISILCLAVILSYKSIYSFFENVALVLVEKEEDDDEP